MPTSIRLCVHPAARTANVAFFVRAASKLTEAEIQNNFVILLHCFHFLTKRSFVYTPSPEAEPINIGRTKNKDRTKDRRDTIPSSGTACARLRAALYWCNSADPTRIPCVQRHF